MARALLEVGLPVLIVLVITALGFKVLLER